MDTKRAKYVVIFTAEQSSDLTGYTEMQLQVREEAEKQPGFCGIESIEKDGKEITLSYWESMEAIQAWSKNPVHKEAKRESRRWLKGYSNFTSEIK